MGNPHRDRDRKRRRGGDDFGNQMEDAFARYGKMDVSVDGQRQDNAFPRGRQDRPSRSGPPARGNERHQDRRPQRPKLEFAELVCLERGDCRCRVTAADGHSGRIYNFAVERQNRDRTTRFFRESDAQDLANLVKQAAEWIEAQRGA
jgi:hypothetical protein